MMAVAAVGSGAANGQDVRLELAAPVPFLRVLGTGLSRIRIHNATDRPLEGGPPQDWDAGLPLTFVGQWFTDKPALQMGQFETTLRLPDRIPPGGSVEITVPLRPVRPGRHLLCFGLIRSSRDGKAYGQVGSPLCLPVGVAGGSALANHRPELLKGLLGFHWLVIVGGALIAAAVAGRRR
jgi:hypothetical protein